MRFDFETVILICTCNNYVCDSIVFLPAGSISEAFLDKLWDANRFVGFYDMYRIFVLVELYLCHIVKDINHQQLDIGVHSK